MSHPLTWVTSEGLIGVYPAQVPLTYKVVAIAEPPYVIDGYKIISGSLPNGLLFRDNGLIYGTPDTTSVDETYTFVVRVTSNDGTTSYIKDRTFSLEITGEATPSLTPFPPETISDSVWYTKLISYNNPISDNPVSLRIIQGSLPPGLEMNSFGLIRGYAEPPIVTVNLSPVNTVATATNSTTNYITVLSTTGFSINRPIVFSTDISNIVAGKTYYIKEIVNITQFTISEIPNGVEFAILSTISSFSDVTLPLVAVGEPTKRQYTFTVDLTSPAGNDRQNYTIIVRNQNLPLSLGGEGKTPGTRDPTIFNTRPPTYDIEADPINYGYYVLPPPGSVTIPGTTYSPSQQAYIGQFQSDNFFSFHVLGHDFDNLSLEYIFNNYPDWLTVDTTTGWIFGNPVITGNNIEQFSFTVQVRKVVGGIDFISSNFNFSFRISNNIDGDIVWITDSDLGTLYNSSISYKNIIAESDVPLLVEEWSGSLPPNLSLTLNGELRGVVAYQPTNEYQEKNQSETFSFTVKAYNPDIMKDVPATIFSAGERYFIKSLGTTNFVSIGATEVTANNFVGGEYYLINNLGNTDFESIGATNVIAGNFIVGTEYIITSVGTTNFTLIGAPDSSVGTKFVATAFGTGTGTAYPTEFMATNPGTGTGTAIEKTFYATGAGTGTGVAETYLIQDNKTFTLTVDQVYDQPTDNLYVKCTPSIGDRNILATLLDDSILIPENYLYRPTDPYFGKASSITYAHAYGIYSSDIQEYIEAVQKNYYWKNVTLGQLSTAVARDENNNIIYEVVYSNVLDNLQKYDPKFGIDYRYSTSISEEVYWPRFIDLNLGPWYTSSDDIYTSYVFNQDAMIITELREYSLLTQTGIPLLLNSGVPTFYTSLTPGYTRTLYPNSLDNMRNRVEQTLGANYNFRLLPLWMTSQQEDGNTLGYTPAWVIAYTKPAELINTTATQTYAGTTLLPPRVVVESTLGFVVGRPIIFTGNTFGNIINGKVYYIKEILSSTEIVITNSVTYDQNDNPVPGVAYSLYTESSAIYGPMTVTFDPVSYASIIKERIEKDWAYTLNEIDFDMDRFTVDKTITYDFDAKLNPGVWLEYPSATPTPEPIDSENFYVLFPRRNILSRIGSDEITG